jgi:hypothetical protein
MQKLELKRRKKGNRRMIFGYCNCKSVTLVKGILKHMHLNSIKLSQVKQPTNNNLVSKQFKKNFPTATEVWAHTKRVFSEHLFCTRVIFVAMIEFTMQSTHKYLLRTYIKRLDKFFVSSKWNRFIQKMILLIRQ